MSDDRHEELASLYALDLLEAPERAQFESTLAREPALQALVRDLRETTATLALAAPPVPAPPALKDRVLSSIPALRPAAGNVIRPPASIFARFAPWAVAACFAVAAAWTSLRYLASQTEAALLGEKSALAAISLKGVRQQLEAEQILAGRQLEQLGQQLAAANLQLTASRTQIADRDRTVTEQEQRLADLRSQLAERERLLADARTRLADREQAMASLTQRVEALASYSAEAGRQLGEARQRVAQLTSELKAQGDLADFKITTLASMLKNSPKALAVAVWDPTRQEGVLKVEQLPALLADQDYQLWVVDPQYPIPVDGGVFTVDPQTGSARLNFKAKQPVAAVSAFAVTRERKGGVPKAEGPFVLLGK